VLTRRLALDSFYKNIVLYMTQFWVRVTGSFHSFGCC
jgi:hypothetical protein